MENAKCLKCSVIPQRVVLATMGFFGCGVVMAIDICFFLAITEMVVPLNHTAIKNSSAVCPVDAARVNSGFHRQVDAPRYNWTQQQQGWIFSSKFNGSLVSNVASGFLAEKYGGKLVVSFGILLLAVGSIATAAVIDFGGYNPFIILRMVMGFGSGVIFPALAVLMAAWIPKKERAKLAGFVYSGSPVGPLIAWYLTGLMLSHWPWPAVFYVWGGVGLIWFIAFTILCSSDPASHPCITKEELEYLQKELGQSKRQDHLPPTPWKDILTSVPVITYIIGQMATSWCFFILTTDVPKYMREVLGFSVYDVGVYSSLNVIAMVVVSILFGILSDYVINRKFVTITRARKIATALSGVLPVGFLVLASYAGCNKVLVLIALLFCKGSVGPYFSGMRLNPLDLSPNYAGSLNSLSFGFGALTGSFVPTLVGIMVPNSTIDEWRLVFWITFGVAVLNTIIYSIWASAEVQPWNSPKDLETSENIKLNEQKQKFFE